MRRTLRAVNEAQEWPGTLSRRQFVAKASALGLTAGAAGAILAACGGDADAPAAQTDPAPTAPSEPAVTPIRAADVQEGELAAFDVGETKVAVANVEGKYYAFDDRCTHLGCSLGGGSLEGRRVVCPCHFGEFDVRTGEVLKGPPTEPVNTYTVEVVGNRLEIEVP